MHALRSLAALALLTLFTSCAHSPAPAPAGDQITDHQDAGCSRHHSLDATLWLQTSAEYQASTTQTFHHATRQMEQALADPTWTAALEQESSQMADLPTAIIVDVDETILDNSPFQARLVADQLVYSPEPWNSWVNQSAAVALRGAKDFLTRADELGITIFYVTNREAETEPATRKNLQLQHLPIDESRDTVLMKGENGWSSDKKSRRQAIAETHRILLLLGDDLNDFVSGAKAKDPTTRRDLADSHKSMWGTRWFLFVNPTYGSWEASLYERDFSKPEQEKQTLKCHHLSPFKP